MTLEEHCEERWPLGWRHAGNDRAQAEVGDFSLIVKRTGNCYYCFFTAQIRPKDSVVLLAEREEDELRDLMQWAFAYVKEHPPYIPELTP